MSSQDTLNYCLGFGFLVLVAFLCYVLYRLAQVLKTLKLVLEDTEDITKDVAALKNSLKFGALNILSQFIKPKKRR